MHLKQMHWNGWSSSNSIVWTLNAELLSSAEISFEIIVFGKYVFQEY